MNLADVKEIHLGTGEEVIKIESNGVVWWQKSSPEPQTDLFYIKDESGNGCTITVTPYSPANATLYYSSNATDWTSLNIDGQTTAVTFSVPANKKVWLKGSFDGASGYYNIIGSDYHSIGGNILSICDETNYASMTSIPTKAFYWKFRGDNTLVNASNCNFGVADTVGTYSFTYMFYECTVMTEGPDMSSLTTIGSFGLSSMFFICSALNITPNLSNITTIDTYAFSRTFYGCTSLTSGPNLSGITSIPSFGLDNTFYGCTSLVTPPNLSNITSIANYGLYKTFRGCTSLTNGANLSNVTTVNSQYGLGETYYGCSALTVAYAPNVSTWSTSPTTDWLNGVASSGTLYCQTQNLVDTIPTGNSGCPANWTKTLIQ